MATEKLLEEFPPVSTAAWEAAIARDLRGADYEKKLIWHTEEGLAVKPYYRAEDLAGLAFVDAAQGEFPNQGMLVDFLKESGAQSIRNLKDGSQYTLRQGIQISVFIGG